MATVTNVVTLCQNLLNDVAGDYWTITTLLPLINEAYRDIGREVKNGGVDLGRARQTITTFPANTTTLSRTLPTGKELSSDFLQPKTIWEKDDGASDITYQQLEYVSNGLPFVTTTTTLRYWDWYSGNIKFLGATAARTLLIEYLRGFTELTGGSDTLVFDEGLDPTAHLAAALAFSARGDSAQAAENRAVARRQVDAYISYQLKTQQRIPRRRMAPFNYTSWRL